MTAPDPGPSRLGSGPGQPGYSWGQPGYFPGQPAWRPTNQLAIASLACAAAQVLIPILTAIPAIILGHMARRQIRMTGENGDGLALAGLIIGYAGVVIGLIGLIVFLSFLARINQQAPGGFP
jgi:hypothetical protein